MLIATGVSTHIHACVKKAVRQLGLYMTQTMYRQIQYTVTPNNIYDVLTSHSLWYALMQIHPQGHMVKLSHFLPPAIPWSYCFLSGSRSEFLLSQAILPFNWEKLCKNTATFTVKIYHCHFPISEWVWLKMITMSSDLGHRDGCSRPHWAAAGGRERTEEWNGADMKTVRSIRQA